MGKKKRILGVILTSVALVLLGGCTSPKQAVTSSTLKAEDVTLVTKVLPQGEVAESIAIDLGDAFKAADVKKENFAVTTMIDGDSKKRKITKVSTKTELIKEGKSVPGNYLVIELDETDPEANTTSFDPESFLSTREYLDYVITFKTPIKTENGTEVTTPEEGIANGQTIAPDVDKMSEATFNHQDLKLNYRFFEPETQKDELYPLVLFLHGAGERGRDNFIHVANSEGASAFTDKEFQKEHPAYVLAPQSDSVEEFTFFWTEEDRYQAVLTLVEDIIETNQVDRNRIYVIGMSMGGVGTWNLIEKNPELFAAAVPICGVANFQEVSDTKAFPLYAKVDREAVGVLKNIPIWAFHGIDDPIIDVKNSRELFDAIKADGGTLMNYTEFPEGTSHAAWSPALENAEMKEWLFSQEKNRKSDKQ